MGGIVAVALSRAGAAVSVGWVSSMAIAGKKRWLSAAVTRGGERESPADDGAIAEMWSGAGVSNGANVVWREERGSTASLRCAKSASAMADLVVGDGGALDAMSATR